MSNLFPNFYGLLVDYQAHDCGPLVDDFQPEDRGFDSRPGFSRVLLDWSKKPVIFPLHES